MPSIGVWSDPVLEARLGDAVSLREPWAVVKRFSTLVRLCGSDHERQAAHYILEKLRSWDIPAYLHTPDLCISQPRRAELTVLGAARHPIACQAPFYSLSTGDAGVTGELVYVSGACFAGTGDLVVTGVAVPGKIVITEGLPIPAKVEALARRGARAALFIAPGERADVGRCIPKWGAPELADIDINLAVGAVGKSDGAALIELARSEGTAVTLKTWLDEGWWPCPVIEVRLPGTVWPDEFVLLHGHLDSWYEGAGDNASGDATLLEVARVLGANRDQLRRGVRILWWSGHAHGLYGGSAWYADTFAEDLDRYCVAHIHCDAPGRRWATAYEDVFRMRERQGAAEGAIHAPASQAGDQTVPDPYILLKDIKSYLTGVLRAANAPVLPLDYTDTAEEIAAAAERYDEASGGVANIAAVAEAARALQAGLERFSADLPPSPSPAQASQINAAIRRLGRILIPLCCSRTGPFAADPTIEASPLPDLALAPRLEALAPASHEYHVVLTHLRRGVNRALADLREAHDYIAGVCV